MYTLIVACVRPAMDEGEKWRKRERERERMSVVRLLLDSHCVNLYDYLINPLGS